MRVDTMGRHHINANNVVKLLHKGVILQITSEHTRGRYNTITNATSVVKLSLQGVNLQSMCGHTGEMLYQCNQFLFRKYY